MKKNNAVLPYVFFGFLSLGFAFFYYFKINLSIDLILLFIAQKIFLGKWLLRGVVPFFNPHMFAGVPFLFDVGMGNIHPFNIFFLLPYPLSFSVWIFASFFLFFSGFFLFFRLFTRSNFFAVFLTLILFFSGSGYWRVNNPTIFLVIAHFGIFLYALSKLKKKSVSLLCVGSGFFLVLSGHIQFVLYGLLLGLLVSIFIYKIPIKRLIFHYFLLAVSVSWYIALSLPLVIESTRMTSDIAYVSMGKLPIQQLLQLILPFFFGYIKNGSWWNAGYTYVLLISLFFTLAMIYLLFTKKMRKIDVLLLLFLLLAATGLFNFPFFRAPSQIFLLIHIWGLYCIACQEETIYKLLTSILQKKIVFFSFLFSLLLFIFFSSSLFLTIFLRIYTFIKKRPPNLFFDNATITSIGNLIGLNFVIWMAFFFFLFLFQTHIQKKGKYILLLFFVFIEGLTINFFHNYYIDQTYVTKKYGLPKDIHPEMYRVQTGADVIPYFGFHTYMGNVLFRPPFSKEPSLITPKEEQSRNYLQMIMSFYPSTWGMTYGISSIQGYNTFVPKDVALFFKESSSDYKAEYAGIIARNSLFGQSEKGLAINGIETSKLTLYDQRWEQLAVRYFISDKPLKSYRFLKKDGQRYFYENKSAPAMFSIGSLEKMPVFLDPNGMTFSIKPDEVGDNLIIRINPHGFVAKLNGKKIKIQKTKLQMSIPLETNGTLEIYYSPLQHFSDLIRRFI